MFRARPIINALDGVKGLRAPIARSRLMSNEVGGLAEHLMGTGSTKANRMRRTVAVGAEASRKRGVRAMNPLLGPGTVAQHGQAMTMRQIRQSIGRA